MSKDNYNPIKAGLTYTIGNMLVKGIPFLTLPIFTRIMTTSDFGLYNTYLSYENILSIILGFGLYGTIRIAKYQYRDHFEDYISSIYGLQILISIFIYPILYFIFPLLNLGDWIDSRILLILLGNCLCTVLYNVASAKYAISGAVKNNLIIAFILTIFNVLLSLIFCLTIFKNERYLGRIIGTFLATVIIGIVVLYFQSTRSRKFFDKEKWKFGLKMGVPLIPHMLALTLLSQCDKIMIQSFVGSAEAGIYSFAVNILMIMTVLITSIDNAWAPWFYQKLDLKQYEEICKRDNEMIIGYSVLASLFLLIAPDVIKIMAQKSYWDSIYALAPLIVSTIFSFAYLIPVNLEYFHKKTWYISFSTLFTALLNIVLNYIFIKKIGYIGAAYATCISKAILLIMHWMIIKKIQDEKVANMSILVCSSIIVIIIAIISIIFSFSYLIRYLSMAVILVISIYFVNSRIPILDIIKKRR